MTHKFLYIDDLDKANANGIIVGLQKDSIEITYSNPKGDWEEEIKRLSEQAKNYQGIIFDLRLQEKKNEEEKFSQYSGAILAHHFREIVKSGDSSIKDMPLILLSGNNNLQRYFDGTGKDAFDLCISKDDLNGHEQFEELRRHLIALASGYININSSEKRLDKLLEITEEELNLIDERFQKKIKSFVSTPTHDLAGFIIHEFIEKEGIIITEDLLAARLGIDTNNSSGWVSLLENLNNCKYSGVFSEGWDRWWMYRLQDWWSSSFGHNNIRSMSAIERVRLIKEKFGLNGLEPAPKIPKARSDSFWTLCKGLKKPLDPVDGLVVSDQDTIFPWQEREYVSYEAAVNSIKIEGWKSVAPSEKNKLEQLKKMYSNERIPRQ